MKTIKRIGVSTLLGLAALTASPAAWALGLGDATVQSYLDQPLRVRIDLITQEKDDLSSLTARLASAEDYQLIGANRESIPVPVSFSIEDLEGDAYIEATSSLPFGNPVLRLIVEVDWSNGRLLREYTLFLDPPAAPAAAPAPRLSEPEEAPSVPEAPPPRAVERAAEPSDRPSRATVTVEPEARGGPAAGEYGPVQSGETLWRIASDWSRGAEFGVNQAMIAIQRENPDAFLRDNINLLKRGAILRLPSAEQVARLSRPEANREVAMQAEAFAGGDRAATVASPQTPLIGAEAATRPADREPPATEPPAPEEGEAEPAATEEAPQDSVATAAEPGAGEADEPVSEAELRDQLELVPPAEKIDAESAGALGEPEAEEEAAAVASLREDLARTEEELFNQRQQNAYLEERIRELEAQAETGSAGVQDEELASMEERLRQERLAAAAAREEPVPWYANLTLWLFVLLGVAVVVIVWLVFRGRKDQGDSLAAITGEAEEVLRVLEEEEESPAEEELDIAEEPPAAEEVEPTVEQKAARTFGETGDDAEFLDAESSDPEIQLDLARAYISMGDKEAARVILEEVVANGNEEQKAEAEKMLDLL